MMKTFADAEERLVESLPGYESRPQQQTLARSVETMFSNPSNTAWQPDEFAVDAGAVPVVRRHLFGQAGCGTGKSLGYLIPAILSAVAENRRVIVSVTTKALQDQLADKDVPFLQEHLGTDFSWTVLKGRSNYFCTTRAQTADLQDVPMLPELLKIANEAGFSGLRDDFEFEIPHSQWAKVCADADDCRDNNCKDRPAFCYAEQARARAKSSTLVVVNHALFFTDLMVKVQTGAGAMLDDYDFVIFDEAHEMEEVAGNTLGFSFTEGTIRALTGEVRNWADRYADQGVDAVSGIITDVMAATDTFFRALPGEKQTERLLNSHLNALVAEFGTVYSSLNQMRTALSRCSLENASDYTKAMKRKTSLVRRCNNLIDRFGALIADSFDDTVRWVEKERTRTGEERKVVKAAPINVAPFLKANLFSYVPCIMVSATLAVKGEFSYIAGRLGVENFDGIDVGTPFDFIKQARLYVPVNLPEPKGAQVPVWETQCREEIVDLVKASKGRALVLFTSMKQMRETYDAVQKRLPYTLMMQGQAAPRVLAERFKNEESSVLFGTKSFFTGVDFQGETCSLVIIAKMPFPVPTEPMTEARCEAIERNGGNSFGDYTIPVMSLTLQQAAGRLIRHRDDQGVVAILDPRIATKGYGKQIMSDLPPMPFIKTLSDVEDFFSEIA